MLEKDSRNVQEKMHGKREFVHINQIDMETRRLCSTTTEEGTTTTILPQEDQKLRKRNSFEYMLAAAEIALGKREFVHINQIDIKTRRVCSTTTEEGTTTTILPQEDQKLRKRNSFEIMLAAAEIALGKREVVHINQIDMETRRVCYTTTEEGTTTTILPQEDQKLRKRNSFEYMLAAAEIALGKREFVHINQIDMETRRLCCTTTEEGTTTTILPQEDQKLRKRNSFEYMLAAAEIALGKREFVHINQTDMETRRVCSTTTEEGTTTTILPQEDQKLRKRNSFEIMLAAAEIALGKREFVHINQIDMETRRVCSTTTEEGTTTTILPQEDQKLRKRNSFEIMLAAAEIALGKREVVHINQIDMETRRVRYTTTEEGTTTTILPQEDQKLRKRNSFEYMLAAAEIALGKREFVHINQIDMETRRLCSTTTEEGTTTTILPQEDQKLRKRNSFEYMLAAAEIALEKREFVHINQIDMETRRVCSTTTEEGTTTTILPQEDQKLRKRNSFEIMLAAAEIALGKREFVHINQIDMETRRVCSTTTEEGTTTTILPQEDQKLRKRKRQIVHPMQRRSQEKKKRAAKTRALQKLTSNTYI